MTTAPAYTQAQWAQLLLSDAGLPQTGNNVDNVERWMTAEEPTSDWYDRNNPLNASLGTASSDGLGSYPDLGTGAQETADMLKQANMSGIYNALAANAAPSQFSAAVVGSPWASGHYGGNPGAIASIPVPSGAPVSTGDNASYTASLASFPGGAYDPLNIPSEIIGSAGSAVLSAIEPFVIRGILMVIGIILLAVGVDKLFNPNASPTDIALTVPDKATGAAQGVQSAASGPEGGTRGMEGPGAAHPGGVRGRAKHAAPKAHPLRRGAEHGAEGAAAVAAA